MKTGPIGKKSAARSRRRFSGGAALALVVVLSWPLNAPAAARFVFKSPTTGSFSTNYFRAELHGRFIFGADDAFRSGWIVGGSLAVETNLHGGPGGITDEQREIYGDGFYEIQGTVQRLWSGNRARTLIGAAYPYGETPSRRRSITVEAAFVPEWAGGFGLFARHVSGQDDYNILFLEQVNFWLSGILFELGPGVTLPLADPKGS